jgi:hypothetical protein
MNLEDVTELRMDMIELLGEVRELLCDVAREHSEPEPLLTDVNLMILKIDRAVERLR